MIGSDSGEAVRQQTFVAMLSTNGVPEKKKANHTAPNARVGGMRKWWAPTDATVASTPITFALEALIGAGKSTFLELFQKTFAKEFPSASTTDGGISIFPEPLDEWRDFIDYEGNSHNILKLFYEDPKRWAFLFQETTWLTRIDTQPRGLDEARAHGDVCVFERCLQGDRLFGIAARGADLMSPVEFSVYDRFYSAAEKPLAPHMNFIVYLRVSPETAHARIAKRNRKEETTSSGLSTAEGEAESSGIPLLYLKQLYWLHESYFAGVAAPTDPDDESANFHVAKYKVEPLSSHDVIILEADADFESWDEDKLRSWLKPLLDRIHHDRIFFATCAAAEAASDSVCSSSSTDE